MLGSALGKPQSLPETGAAPAPDPRLPEMALQPEPLATIPPLDTELAAKRPENRSTRYNYLSCCGRTNRASRIIGGDIPKVREYPWMAALVYRGGSYPFCGGSIINDRYVLTAAHCVDDKSTSAAQVLLGDHSMIRNDGQKRFDIAKIIIHPSYDNAKLYYDFALLKLTSIISFANNRMAPACLADVGSFAGYPGIATGWGALVQNGDSAWTLREATLDIWSNSDCKTKYGSYIIDATICAGGNGRQDICQGDSGGPLVTELEKDRYLLIGVTSFNYACAKPGYPSGFARVSYAYDWIMENTADADYCLPS